MNFDFDLKKMWVETDPDDGVLSLGNTIGFIVDDDGIKLSTGDMVIPKNIFIDAYKKYISDSQ